MRNREIASALHYSPRGVEVHLSRIYVKLGISSRLELARVLDNAERLSVVEPTLAPPRHRG
jgi:DNA-binding NarL/FixJ family response regulator